MTASAQTGAAGADTLAEPALPAGPQAGPQPGLHSGARGAETLDLYPGQSARARRIMALSDLVEAGGMWRLCWTLSWLDIRLRYRGSLIGPFWLTLSTGVMVAALGLIYSQLFGISMQDYLPFVAASQVLWGYWNSLVSEGCTGYTASEGMIRSIRMPFSLYAARIGVRNVLVLFHNLLVIVVVFAIFHTWPGAKALLALPGFALWMLDSLAAAMLLGMLCARFRDIPPIVGSIMQIAFFATPIIWKPDALKTHEWVLPFNPFFSLLEVVRGPLLDGVPNHWVYLSALGYSALLCLVTWLLFARVRGRIAFWV